MVPLIVSRLATSSRAFCSGGRDGSNPLPSSAESDANSLSLEINPFGSTPLNFIYSAGAVSVMLGFRAVLYYWFLPAILAQPFLRALLIVEHAGCSQNGNGLTNTRTTLT